VDSNLLQKEKKTIKPPHAVNWYSFQGLSTRALRQLLQLHACNLCQHIAPSKQERHQIINTYCPVDTLHNLLPSGMMHFEIELMWFRSSNLMCCKRVWNAELAEESVFKTHWLLEALSNPRLNNQRIFCRVGDIYNVLRSFLVYLQSHKILKWHWYCSMCDVQLYKFSICSFRFVVCCNWCLLALGIWHKMSCTSQQAQSCCGSTFQFNFLWKKRSVGAVGRSSVA